MTRTTKRSARRAGFTLVEMLVVVTIIVILLSLTTAAVLQTIGNQQISNTQTELTRLEGDLIRAYRSAADKFRKEPIPTSGPMNAAYYNAILPMSATPSQPNGDRDRARVIWTKLRLKQTFPNNFSEALNPAPTLTTSFGVPNIALSYYQTKLGAVGYNAGNTPDTALAPYQPAAWESSVCLLLALQRGEDGPALKESDIGTGSLKDFGQTALVAKDPSSGFTRFQLPIKGLVDNWGTPLAFCRWPVYSLQLNPAPAGVTNPPAPPAAPGIYYPQPHDNNDPDDPSGLLESTTWQASAGFGQFEALCHPLVQQRLANNEAQTYRITPLIVSAGPDKRLGLDKEPVGAGPIFPLTAQPSHYYFGVRAGLPGTPGSLSKDNIYPTLAAPK